MRRDRLTFELFQAEDGFEEFASAILAAKGRNSHLYFTFSYSCCGARRLDRLARGGCRTTLDGDVGATLATASAFAEAHCAVCISWCVPTARQTLRPPFSCLSAHAFRLLLLCSFGRLRRGTCRWGELGSSARRLGAPIISTTSISLAFKSGRARLSRPTA